MFCKMLIVIRAGWLVRACRRCSSSAQESRASLPECVGDACFTRSSGKTPGPIRKIQRTPSPDLANSRKHAQKILLKCLWRLTTVLYQLRCFHSLHLDSPQYELVQTEYWSRPQNSLPPCSGKWRNLELVKWKRSKTHTYWRFVLQLCKQSMVISKARLVYEKIFFFENPLWGWKIMLVMLHPCIFVLQ